MSRIVYGWRDLRMPILAGRLGTANFPELAAFGPTGNIEQLKFAVNDYVYVAGHIDHDVREGSTMYPHVHWSTSGINVQPVHWEISWTMAKGHNQDNFGADTVVTMGEAAHGTVWRHMVTEDPVGFTAEEVDSLWIAKVRRITNGSVDNTDNVFGLFVDLHYQVQQYATPYRTPNFYSGS